MATSKVQANRAASIRSHAGSYSGLAAAAVLAIAMGVGLNVAIFNGSLQNFSPNGPAMARTGLEGGAQPEINKDAYLQASIPDRRDNEREAVGQSPVSRPASLVMDLRQSRLKTAWNRLNSRVTRGNTCSNSTGDFIRSLVYYLANEVAIDKATGRISSLFLRMTTTGRGKEDSPGE
jgi:hypothetical protein